MEVQDVARAGGEEDRAILLGDTVDGEDAGVKSFWTYTEDVQ